MMPRIFLVSTCYRLLIYYFQVRVAFYSTIMLTLLSIQDYFEKATYFFHKIDPYLDIIIMQFVAVPMALTVTIIVIFTVIVTVMVTVSVGFNCLWIVYSIHIIL